MLAATANTASSSPLVVAIVSGCFLLAGAFVSAWALIRVTKKATDNETTLTGVVVDQADEIKDLRHQLKQLKGQQ